LTNQARFAEVAAGEALWKMLEAFLKDEGLNFLTHSVLSKCFLHLNIIVIDLKAIS
jgi:hypothetical protein